MNVSMLIAVGAPTEGTKGHGRCLLNVPGLLLKVSLKVLLKVPLLIVDLLNVRQFADCSMTGWRVLAIIFYVHTQKLFFRAPAAPRK
jgi:hypothetical protein